MTATARKPKKTAAATGDALAVHYSSGTPEWYTPPEMIALVLQVLGEIDLDPCSNAGTPNVPARQHYTASEDGLFYPWQGTVYMNPPYGDAIPPWIVKLVNHYRFGQVTEAIALVPARPDTQWFKPLYDFPICFVEGRITFLGGESGAPFPSAFAYLGTNQHRFIKIFGRIGTIVGRLAEVQP